MHYVMRCFLVFEFDFDFVKNNPLNAGYKISADDIFEIFFLENRL